MKKYNFDEPVNRWNTNSVKYDFAQKYFKTDDLIPMWVADMDLKAPDFIMEAMEARLQHPVFGYTLKSSGFYEAVARWQKVRFQWEIQEDWVSFSPGVVPAVSMSILAYTNPGDKIIVQSPVYHPFFSVVKGNKRELVNNPLKRSGDSYEMDFDHLESVIDQDVKMLILCSPHNPVGRVWRKDELERLAEICIKNDILILSDEIHQDIVYQGNHHIPLASLSPEIREHVITAVAPSKTFNIAGLAASAVIIPNKKLHHRYEKILNDLHLGMGNIFGFVALKAAYMKGEDWLDQMMAYLEGNVNFAGNFIKERIPGIKMIRPEATYLLWLDCNGLGMGKQELKEFMIHEAKLGLNDGPTFGSGGEGFQRMNIGCQRETLRRALEQLENAVNNRS